MGGFYTNITRYRQKTESKTVITISIRFTTGRYYARPWTANKGSTVEWPPSPYRLLRAIVASWKYNAPHIGEEHIRGLIRKLASGSPEFHLPPMISGYEHGIGPTRDDRSHKACPYGTICGEEPVQFIWTDLSMDCEEAKTLQEILENILYFGKTKSWCSMTLDGNARASNCTPQRRDASSGITRKNTRDVAVVLPKPDITLDDIYTTRNNLRKNEGAYPDGSQVVRYLMENSRHVPG